MNGQGVICPDRFLRARGSRAARPLLLLLLLLVLQGGAQNNSQLPQQLPGTHLNQQLTQEIGLGQPVSVEEEKQLRMLNAERQKSMVADANKLLKLARELDSEVGSANANPPTVMQLRKLAEIEKLAHNVKEKMSTSVRSGPAWLSPIIIPTR